MRKTGKLKNDPPVKPVRSIEVPVKVTKKKILLIAALLAVGITLIVFAVVKFLTVPKGWQIIEPPAGLENTYAYEFSLNYLLGETDQKTNREKNAVSELYVKAAADAYRIFSEDEIKDVKNIYYINQHPGQTVTVAPELYQALSLLTANDRRALYLGPVYEYNQALISNNEDAWAEEYHPDKNESIKAIYEKLLPMLNDPQHITLELLGNNQVRLNVSQEYLQYAKEISTQAFISLDWMRNAFVTDYIADTLIAKGYTNGILTSYDGFIRNLDPSNRSYDYTVFDGTVSRNYRVATMQYSGIGAMVWLRSYPISTDERQDYYYWEDGSVTHTHLDPADGKDKVACSDLVVYSRKLSCAQVLMQSVDIYIADTLDWTRLGQLPGTGVEFILVHNKAVYASDKKVTFTNLVYGEPKFELPGGEK